MDSEQLQSASLHDAYPVGVTDSEPSVACQMVIRNTFFELVASGEIAQVRSSSAPPMLSASVPDALSLNEVGALVSRCGLTDTIHTDIRDGTACDNAFGFIEDERALGHFLNNGGSMSTESLLDVSSFRGVGGIVSRCGLTDTIQTNTCAGTACDNATDEAEDDNDILADALACGLTEGQLDFLRRLHLEESGGEDESEPFELFMEGCMHEAAESGLPLSDYVAVYLEQPRVVHESTQIESHPLVALIGGRRPEPGWLNLRCVVSQLQQVRRMALPQLEERVAICTGDLGDNTLSPILTAYPELFEVAGTGRRSMVSLKRVQVHRIPCPSAGQVQRIGRRILCHCAWEVCNWLHNSEHSGASQAGNAEDEAEPQEAGTEFSDEEEWWNFADAGVGCDAEAVVASLCES